MTPTTRCQFSLQGCSDTDLMPVQLRAEVPASRGGGRAPVLLLACASCRAVAVGMGASVVERRSEPQAGPRERRLVARLRELVAA